jgi:3-methylfumaryl-CoA hydratase
MAAEPAAVRRVETVDSAQVERYRVTFATGTAVRRDGAALPPGWEAVTFPFDSAFADLRPDGSPAADGLLPDVDLSRRMYAGEDTSFHRQIRIGDRVEQISRLGAVSEKTGRSGRLVFADLVREYRVDGELAIESTWHDVFLEAAGASTTTTTATQPAAAPFDLDAGWWTEQLTLDARALFRFSAITYNTHLVHYDRDWAVRVEGLTGLLVHGPLTRMLLLDAGIRRFSTAVGGHMPSAFSFRSHAPLFVDQPITIAGRGEGAGARIVALDQTGVLAASGILTW